MNFSSGLFSGHKRHAHLLGLLCQVVQDTLAVALFEVVLPVVDVLLALGQHGVDQSRQLVGCSELELVSMATVQPAGNCAHLTTKLSRARARAVRTWPALSTS